MVRFPKSWGTHIPVGGLRREAATGFLGRWLPERVGMQPRSCTAVKSGTQFLSLTSPEHLEHTFLLSSWTLCPQISGLRTVAHSQVIPSLKQATPALQEAFSGASLPMAEGANVGEEVQTLEVPLCIEEATPAHWDSTVGMKPGTSLLAKAVDVSPSHSLFF